MKKLFFILTLLFVSNCVVAQNDVISPTACGITVGETTKTGKTMAQWDDILKDYRPMNLIVCTEDQEVRLGDFVVEGLHMSILNMELMNDTVYQISFYEESPYVNCWDSYKDIVFKLRDKYAHFEDVTEPITFDYDSVVTFYKTDGKTRILFAASPNSLSLILTNVHFYKIQTQKLSKEFNSLGRMGPNYDEKNKVTSIAGVRFGETRTNTINAFKQRGRFLKNEDNITYFSNVNFGGSTYSIAKFYFEYDKRRYENVLAAAKFEKNFYEWRREEAVMMYEAVTSSFSSKYTNGTIIKDEEDEKMMMFGMLSDDYADGKIPPIIVSFDLGISRGGDKFYYVSVSYFVQRMSRVDSDDL